MIDRELISKKLEQIEQALGVLEKRHTLTASELELSIETRWSIERGLEVIMQAVFDVGAHLLAADLKNDWDDYTGLIEKLGVHGVLPTAFAQKFKAMAGFRNILVHEYLEIDLHVVEHVLNHELPSFREFVRHVMRYLQQSK